MGHFRYKSQAGKRLQILINRERERESYAGDCVAEMRASGT